MGKQVLVTGLLLATASVVAAAWARSMGQDWQTSMFLVLGAGSSASPSPYGPAGLLATTRSSLSPSWRRHSCRYWP